MHVPHAVIRPQLDVRAQASVPTRFGVFQMAVFRWGVAPVAGEPCSPAPESGLSPDHVALIMGDVRFAREVTVRVHSECLTSEVFGSLKCDCKEQLQAAQAEIAARGVGIVIYLRQEGRGIGLANKIRAYDLQAIGHDTVDANRLLGLPDDARDYGAAAAMLEHLGVASIRLMTNNPDKVQALRELGIDVDAQVPSLVSPNAFSAGYLEAKRVRMGHSLPETPDPAGTLRTGPASRPGSTSGHPAPALDAE
jgi:GTP cyclohydrolase II